jgi:hypothetical protein
MPKQKEKTMQISEKCSKSNNYILNATHPLHLKIYYFKKNVYLNFFLKLTTF